jgi:DNA-binding beta-propeller fold protein YncE
MLLFSLLSPPVHADGGAPNLAYVAGTTGGINVIDIAQQRVTGAFDVNGDPQTILLSVDGRLLYVTQPALKRVAVVATYTKKALCTAPYPGHPTLLTLDPGTNTLYAAGTDANVVEAIDPMTCTIRHTLTTSGPVEGIAVAIVGGSILGGNGNQLWVANALGLTIFDAAGKQLANIAMGDGPRYLSIPPGSVAYVTTQQGSVDAVDLHSRRIFPRLLSGGSFGPMDFDETNGEVYVPDRQHNRVDVLAPLSPATNTTHEPLRVIAMPGTPQSIAITSDGQFGFVAVKDGTVVMLDIPGRQAVNTFHVGGQPHFIITGLYPSSVSLTPQQATVLSIAENLSHYAAAGVVVIATIIVIVLNRRRTRRPQ